MAKEKNKKSLFGRLFNKQEVEEDQPEENPEEVEAEEAKDQEEWAADYEGQLTIDVYQTDNDIVIKSTIAGVSPEDIDVTIDNDMIIIKGERKNNMEVDEKDYYYQECYWGSFSRSVILPCDVEADKVQAELKNGILTVRLPKANKTKTKKVSVKSNE